ncbi:MAG TPA: hypothetical protein VGD62_10610, partial [Acidobacteriaceae bacterium]
IGGSPGHSGHLTLRDVSSGEARDVAPSIPGSERTVLTAAAVSPRHTVLSAGFAQTGSTARYFLAASDAHGGNQRIIDTHGYLASAVCEGAGDTIWALGTKPHATGKPPFQALRHYDSRGNILDQALPTRTSDQEFQLAGIDPKQIRLVCTQDNVFVYDAIQKRLYRYGTGTHKTESWVVEGPAGLGDTQVTGFAVSSENKIFLSLKEGENRQHAVRGLFQLVGTKGLHAELRPVAGTVYARKAPGQFWLLLGADGKDLVYVSRPAPGHTELLNWSPPD